MARRRVPASPKPSEIGPHWFKRTAIVEDTTLNWQSSEDLQLALKAVLLGPERVKQTTAWEDLTEPRRGDSEKTCSSRSPLYCCENKCNAAFSTEEKAELGRECLTYAASLGQFCSIDHLMCEHTERCLQADPSFPICDAEGCNYAAGLHLGGTSSLQNPIRYGWSSIRSYVSLY
eukprot:SAG11_NODE_1593_length_4614_cov_13.275305_2_plen_175_part_00